MDRRRFLKTAGAGTVAVLAGCSAAPADESGTETGTTTGSAGDAETLVVGTYSAFVDAPSSSPGAWLKQQFEKEFDATLVWQTPSNELNYYIERQLQNVDAEADVYVGLDTNMLIQIDEKLDSALFDSLDSGALDRQGEIKESLQFDPQGRAVPYDTGYISLVYDETQLTAPKTFEGLTKDEFSGDFIVQNPTSSATGKAFLLHTIKAKGEDGYADYWQRLKDNDVRVLGSWDSAYNAYSEGEAPIVVSYSTDQVYANRYDQNMKKHQIRFLNDQGYANPEGMARFADTDKPELARKFMEFMLRPEVQAEIAVRNVQFPATTTAELPETFDKYAKEPPEAVTFTYDELQGNLGPWTEEWARLFAEK
jgi:thiamine transport system substrate-binding protein